MQAGGPFEPQRAYGMTRPRESDFGVVANFAIARIVALEPAIIRVALLLYVVIAAPDDGVRTPGPRSIAARTNIATPDVARSICSRSGT